MQSVTIKILGQKILEIPKVKVLFMQNGQIPY